MHSTSSQPTRPLPRAAAHGNLQDFFAIGEGRGENLNKPLKLSLSWLKINREQVQSCVGSFHGHSTAQQGAIPSLGRGTGDLWAPKAVREQQDVDFIHTEVWG